jgi:hypothetical protein
LPEIISRIPAINPVIIPIPLVGNIPAIATAYIVSTPAPVKVVASIITSEVIAAVATIEVVVA